MRTRLIRSLKHLQVRTQRASIENGGVATFLERRAKEDVVLDRRVLEPWQLAAVGDSVVKARRGVDRVVQFRKEDFSVEAIDLCSEER